MRCPLGPGTAPEPNIPGPHLQGTHGLRTSGARPATPEGTSRARQTGPPLNTMGRTVPPCGQTSTAALPAARAPGRVLVPLHQALMQADSSDCGRLATDRCKDKGPHGGADDGAWPPPGPGDALCASRHGFPSLWQGRDFKKQWAGPAVQWTPRPHIRQAPPSRGNSRGSLPPNPVPGP